MKAPRKPRTTYRLNDGRTLSAVPEPVLGMSRPVVFIKHGDTYLQVDELGRLAFDDDQFNRWLQQVWASSA